MAFLGNKNPWLIKFCGDVLGQMRKRKGAPEADKQPPTLAATSQRKKRESDVVVPVSSFKAEPQCAPASHQECSLCSLLYSEGHWGHELEKVRVQVWRG